MGGVIGSENIQVHQFLQLSNSKYQSNFEVYRYRDN